MYKVARPITTNDDLSSIVGKARIGDIRHCFCDTTNAREQLGIEATEDFQDGLVELAEWVGSQTATDHVEKARKELEARGLVA